MVVCRLSRAAFEQQCDCGCPNATMVEGSRSSHVRIEPALIYSWPVVSAARWSGSAEQCSAVQGGAVVVGRPGEEAAFTRRYVYDELGVPLTQWALPSPTPLPSPPRPCALRSHGPPGRSLLLPFASVAVVREGPVTREWTTLVGTLLPSPPPETRRVQTNAVSEK